MDFVLPPEMLAKLQGILLDELQSQHAEARKHFARFCESPATAIGELEALDQFFHRLAGNAPAVELPALGALGAMCESAVTLFRGGKLSSAADLELLFSEAMIGIDRVLAAARPVLPRAEGALAPGDAPAEEQPASPDAPLVLVVDDDPFSASLIEGPLRRSGLRTRWFSDPEEALALLPSMHPALILLDVVMPGVSGFEICQRIRKLDGMAFIPILFVTRKGDLSQRVRGLEAGASDYISKPFAPQELVARVRSHLHRALALQDIAVRDGLTQCFNQRFFKRRLSEEVTRGALEKVRLSVAMIDADHFKRVNDTHGHPVGDAVLTMLATSIRGSVRTTDVVARYGGEEFGILFLNAGLPEIEGVTKRLHEKIARAPFRVPVPGTGDILELPITVSIGLTELAVSDTADSLLARADAALYQAKSAGRNRVEILEGLAKRTA